MMRWLLLFIAFPLLSHAAVERLVTLGGDVTEIVYALDAEQSLVARDSTSSFSNRSPPFPRSRLLSGCCLFSATAE